MEKSKLKNLIRESINNLITEQKQQWYCPSEIDMAQNTPSPTCQPVPAAGVPNANFQTFATQQDCQNNTSCCNSSSDGMVDGCKGIEQGDPCTYNSWNNYFSPQNQIDFCNNHCAPGQPYWNGGMYSLPYCPCCPTEKPENICQDPNWLALPLGGEAGEPNYIGSKNNYCDRCSTNNQGPDFPVSWINGQFQYDPQNGINYCECCKSMGKKPELQRLKKLAGIRKR